MVKFKGPRIPLFSLLIGSFNLFFKETGHQATVFNAFGHHHINAQIQCHLGRVFVAIELVMNTQKKLTILLI